MLANGTIKEVEDRCRYIIDTVAKDGGYIMDASALLLNDAKIENVEAMINFTLDYGVYSRSGDTVRDLSTVTGFDRPKSKGLTYKKQKRKPGVCVPWTEKKKELPEIAEREELARRTWENVDKLGYGFCWTNLLW